MHNQSQANSDNVPSIPSILSMTKCIHAVVFQGILLMCRGCSRKSQRGGGGRKGVPQTGERTGYPRIK